MPRVKKGNQEFRITDDQLPDYLKKGFNLIDERGEIVTLGTNEQSVEAIARENKELRRRNRQLEEGVKQRDNTISVLRGDVAQLKESYSADKIESPATDAPSDETSDAVTSGSVPEVASEPSGADEKSGHVCPVCGKVCASAAGLTIHMKTHK